MSILATRIAANYYPGLLASFKMADPSETPVTTGNPGSVIAPQYGSSKITVFVWGKNITLKFLGNTK